MTLTVTVRKAVDSENDSATEQPKSKKARIVPPSRQPQRNTSKKIEWETEASKYRNNAPVPDSVLLVVSAGQDEGSSVVAKVVDAKRV